jgi:hypothetical protein
VRVPENLELSMQADLNMKLFLKIIKIIAFILLLLLAGIGIPLGGAIIAVSNRRQKASDDGVKIEMVEKPEEKQKKGGGDYRLS